MYFYHLLRFFLKAATAGMGCQASLSTCSSVSAMSGDVPVDEQERTLKTAMSQAGEKRGVTSLQSN